MQTEGTIEIDRAGIIARSGRANSQLWARAYGAWGLSYVAYLLGEFDLAQEAS